MAGAPGVSIDASDITAVVQGLGGAGKDLAKAQRRANKKVGENVAAWSRAAARSGTRQQARFANAIQGRSTARVARVTVVARGRYAGAGVAFFGARPLTRTGWNASTYNAAGVRTGGRRRLAGSRPQSPTPWVGNTWIGGRAGEGPQPMNTVIARRLPEIEDMYARAHVDAIAEAFPHGGPSL